MVIIMVNKKRILFSFMVVSLMMLVITNSLSLRVNSDSDDTVAELTLKVTGGSSFIDYCSSIASYLEDIGIDVTVQVKEWSTLVSDIMLREYELLFLGLSGGLSPDRSNLFSEDGNLNIFGIKQTFPYCDQNEQMLEEGTTIGDLEVRKQHYYDWQQLVMDRIIPMLPFYSPLHYGVTWETVRDYNASWGITNCLPYMSYSGTHEGQNDLNVWNEADAMWRYFNPLLADDSPSMKIFDLISEPIVQLSPDHVPLKTGLINNWEKISDTHYKFYLRDNIYWNPSYNVTERTGGSSPLDTIPDGSLMRGLKSDEYSNGNNQQITAKDVVFTLLSYANPEVSDHAGEYTWLSSCYEDGGNPLSLHMMFDGDVGTIGREPFVDFWKGLSIGILPEFFLNSTDSTISYTSGGIKCWGLHSNIINTPQWKSFEESAFSCGKMMLDYYIKNSRTILTKSPFWFGYGYDGYSPTSSFVDTFTIHVIPDQSSEFSKFKDGDLEIFDSLSQFRSDRLLMENDSKFTVYNTTLNYLNFLAFNLENSFIGGYDNYIYLTEEGKEEYSKAAAVRKAISYAINRTEINEIYNFGEAIISDSVMNPYMGYYYYDDIIKYPRNLDLAKEWLDAALAVPSYDLAVKNTKSASANKIVTVGFPTGPGVTTVNIHYRGNLYTWQNGAMENISENYFSFDIGGNHEKDEYIEFYFVFTDANGDTWTSITESFRVGEKFGDTSLSPYPLTFLLIIPVIAIVYRRRMKK